VEPHSTLCRGRQSAQASGEAITVREGVFRAVGGRTIAEQPVMAGGSNQTASIFAAVQAAVEEVHRELLKLARKDPGSPLAGAKYEQIEVRDGWAVSNRREEFGTDLR
jgi:CO/xanthine dehydrogenase Mo-binding subunit